MNQKQNQLPCSEDAEKGLLCSIILEPGILDQLPPAFRTDWFYIPAHQIIFRELSDHWACGVQMDFLAVKAGLAASGQLEDVGGKEALSELWGFVPSPSNWKWYLQRIWECSIRRGGILAAEELQRELFDVNQDDPISRIRHFADRLELHESEERFRSFKEILLDMMDELSTRAEVKAATGGRFAIGALDEGLGGLSRGNLCVISGNTGFGKSALAFQAVRESAARGIPSGVFALEQTPEEVAERILAAESDISMRSFSSGLLSKTEYPNLPASVSRIQGYPIWIVDCKALGLDGIVSVFRWLKSAKNIGLGVVDYIQIVPAARDRRESNREREVADISRKFKLLARDLDIVVLACSQLNDRGQLRESRAIGQDADVVLQISESQSEDAFRREIVIAKHRNGPAGARIPVNFYGQYMKFTDV